MKNNAKSLPSPRVALASFQENKNNFRNVFGLGGLAGRKPLGSSLSHISLNFYILSSFGCDFEPYLEGPNNEPSN